MSVQTDDITPLPKSALKLQKSGPQNLHQASEGPSWGPVIEQQAEDARVVDARKSSVAEEAIERALRPKSLEDYVGQVKVREQLSIFIQAAKQRGEPLDHVLLFGGSMRRACTSWTIMLKKQSIRKRRKCTNNL